MTINKKSELFFIIISIFLGFHLNANARLRFTNIICTEVDKTFIKYEYCYIKAYNRTYSYMSLRAKFLQIPVWNTLLRASTYKRANGYKPFLYNMTFDACKMFSSQKINPVATFFYNLFREYSNLNHSCPYDHDIIVEKLDSYFLHKRLTIDLPVPRGQYLLQMEWIFHGNIYAISRVYAELT